MATGLIATDDPSIHVIRILDAATATTSVPVYASDGVDVGAILDSVYGTKGWPSMCGVAVRTTAGSATMTATLKLWVGYLFSASSGIYLAASPGSAALAGVLNGGSAFDEHATDNINRMDYISFPRLGRKYAVQVTAIGGTSTAVTVDLIFSAALSVS